MSDFSHLIARIDDQCRRAAADSSAGSSTDDVEGLLTEGYLVALRGESRSRRLGERLEVLAQSLPDAEAAIEARTVGLEKRTVDQRVRVLRERLAALREHLLQLRASG